MRFKRAGDDRVFLRHGAAEFVAEIALHLRHRVGDAVPVVLRGDAGQRVGLVAVALEVFLRDLAENAGETALDIVLLLAVGGAQQHVVDLGAGQLGHLLDADDEHEPRLAGVDRVEPHMDRRRAGGAGILDAGRRLEAERRVGLEHQRGREFLLDEAAVHRAEKHLVDIGGRDAGIGERALRDFDDQRFDIAPLVPAEFGVRPTDDAPGHRLSPPAAAKRGNAALSLDPMI